MIDNLVDLSVDIIENIWPTPGHAKVVATKNFIREILRRSKATYFMLQISLFYLFRVKRVVQGKLRIPASDRSFREGLMCCGRRMFLASLMVASKYIHDKGYPNKAWADASGLPLQEINAAEMAFLQMIDYCLYISEASFEKWYTMLDQRLKKRKQQVVMEQPAAGFQLPPSPPAAHHQRLHHPYHLPTVAKVKAVLKTPCNRPASDTYPSPASPSFRLGLSHPPPDLPSTLPST
ncbi:hypothetical protein DM01DRAFT_1340427 [Hesseltinella vesiculosa]|uniref:Cyclin N-terminal domain-containing protein n=1 Tax=Hesseltinella vesiculosa TaxID=101127 RepID=A0A1X2G3Y2_9FUNG|nr:hypothetical protein DM01DRAFT_1340427 [Hesseltinella vesiculosa]